jgi:hypothetical protein
MYFWKLSDTMPIQAHAHVIKVLLHCVRFSAIVMALETHFNIKFVFYATDRVSILLAEVKDGRNAMSLEALK